MEWSVDGQLPEYLALTRMATLSPEVIESVLPHIGVKPGMRVLEVGCGSGEYTFRLAEQVSDVHFVGVDYDAGFVRLAADKAAGKADALFGVAPSSCTYEFLQANGMDLPFEDDSFDAVISHTFLTALPDYMAALAEMCRVCKPGGCVSSITNLGTNFSGTGSMRLIPTLIDPKHSSLVRRVGEYMKKQAAPVNLAPGIPTYKPQRAFAWIGLEGVGAKTLGQYFSLSDNRITSAEYRQAVELMYEVERRGVEKARALRAKGGLTDEEWGSYEEYLLWRKEQLLQMEGHNTEWEWFGSAALLAFGMVPVDGQMPLVGKLRKEAQRSLALRADIEAAGLVVDEQWIQLGPGRSCVCKLKGKERKAKASGLEPASALAEAYGRLMGDTCEKRWRKLEKKARKRFTKHKIAPLIPLLNKDVYSVDLLWETVSEAGEYGFAMNFYDASELVDDLATLIVCEVITAQGSIFCFAAHDEQPQAISRACARALAKACCAK